MVTLYSKTVCPKCIVAKAMLEDSGIKYEVINMDNDIESRDRLVDLGFMSAPIAEYEGKYYANTNQIQELIQELK